MSPTEHGLPPGWRLVPFRDLFHRVERKITLEEVTVYRSAGVRWYGIGAFLREEVLGAAVARKQQWILKEGDIVYNKLFAWKGAFAIADKSVDGCIVSDKYPTYRAHTDVVDPSFLRLFFRTQRIAEQAAAMSKGAAAISKFTLNPPDFWKLVMPVPPLETQRRMAAEAEAITSKIDEACALRSTAVRAVKTVTAAAVEQVMAGFDWSGSLQDVLTDAPRNGWSPTCDNTPDGTPVLSLGAVTGYRYRPDAYKRTAEATDPQAHYWLREGDLLVTRSNTPELVGHAAIYTGEPSPCIYPDLMMRLRINEARASTKFVHYVLRSRRVRGYINRNAKGTSPTMRKISQETVGRIPFPSTVSLLEQRAVVEFLDGIVEQVEKAREYQETMATAMDTLLTTIIEEAFPSQVRPLILSPASRLEQA